MSILLIAYHLFLVTDYIAELESQLLVGWSIIGVICLNVLFNIVVFVYIVTIEARQKCRRCQARRAAKKLQQEKARI